MPNNPTTASPPMPDSELLRVLAALWLVPEPEQQQALAIIKEAEEARFQQALDTMRADLAYNPALVTKMEWLFNLHRKLCAAGPEDMKPEREIYAVIMAELKRKTGMT